MENNNVIEEVKEVEKKDEKVLYCSCGNELVGVKFCPKCGKPASMAEEALKKPAETKVVLVSKKSEEPKKNITVFVHAILSIIFLLTGFMFMLGYFIKSATDSNPDYIYSGLTGLIICSLYPMIGGTIVGIIGIAKSEKYLKSSFKWAVMSLIVGIAAILTFVVAVIVNS